MAIGPIPAREWTFEVSDMDPVAPTFIEIGGLENFSLRFDTASEETDDFSSAGLGASLPMRRARSFEVTGQRLEDPATGDRDPGQDQIETTAELIGVAAVADFEVTTPGGSTLAFTAWVALGNQGGGKNNKTAWGGTINVNGAVTVTPPA